jgi:hypothetical protein
MVYCMIERQYNQKNIEISAIEGFVCIYGNYVRFGAILTKILCN